MQAIENKINRDIAIDKVKNNISQRGKSHKGL
jgi:hypothetical protein